MNIIFEIVYKLLKWISAITEFSYREINIIVFFILIPLLIFIIIDKILAKNYFKIGFFIITITTIVLIDDFKIFSSQLFDKSVDFLNWFQIIGLNYTQASVIICVFSPLLILFILMYTMIQSNKKANSFSF